MEINKIIDRKWNIYKLSLVSFKHIFKQSKKVIIEFIAGAM